MAEDRQKEVARKWAWGTGFLAQSDYSPGIAGRSGCSRHGRTTGRQRPPRYPRPLLSAAVAGVLSVATIFHARIFKGMVDDFLLNETIAQPFMAGSLSGQFASPVRDGRMVLSSLTGLGTFPNREPSHKWLGYCQNQRRTTKPRPARQSGSLSGKAQTSRRRLAMTRQAVGETRFTENSPAIYGWVKRHQHKIKSR